MGSMAACHQSVSFFGASPGVSPSRVSMAFCTNFRLASACWFIRDRLNLQAEALARLNALLAGDIPGLYVEEGIATQQSRLDYAEERLRLLYVGITRARKELTITWNTGRQGTSQPALPLRALQTFLKGQST